MDQFVQASYVAAGRDFHDQEDLIGAYSKLQSFYRPDAMRPEQEKEIDPAVAWRVLLGILGQTRSKQKKKKKSTTQICKEQTFVEKLI